MTSLATPPDQRASKVTWALWYAEQGWPVFPCIGKAPATPHGFHDATCDESQIFAWWGKDPTYNIGSPTGVWAWVLDEDPRNHGDNTRHALEQQYGPLPDTLLSLSGRRDGGCHRYWLLPPGGIKHKAQLGEGLDVLAQGGYTILPPSVHPDTRQEYCWDAVYGLDEYGPREAPAWLLALVAPQAQPPRSPAAPAGEPILEGTREATLLRLAGALRRQGATEEEMRAMLEVANGRCVPPLAPADLSRLAHSVARYDPNPSSTFIPSFAVSSGATSQTPTPPPGLLITDLADMLERTYPDPQWLIKGLIPEGLTFLVGSPKSSKTYLAYSLALTLAYEAARGVKWLEQYDILLPGPVVYITLEDDESDSRLRIRELAPWLTTIDKERLLFVHGFELPRFDNGLVEVLEREIVERYHPSMIVLDPISYLYTPTKKGGDQFAEVKDMLLPLRWLGKTHHLAILGIDHRRKKSADDVDIFETTYGSNAKIAVADSLLMVVRDDKEVTINARVRKAADQTLTLLFEFASDGSARWLWKGSSDGIVGQGQYGDLRQRLLENLAMVRIPMSVADLLISLNMPDSRQTRQQLHQILFRAQKSGEVQKTTRGQYVWCGGDDA